MTLALLATALHPAVAVAQEPEWPAPPHRILLLGTFHFVDAGRDSYRPTGRVDILGAERQQQVADLVAQLAAFAPTRVAVEVAATRQRWLDSLYSAYREGRHTLAANEVFQVGFRLARQLGHDRVWAVDADRRFYEPWVDPDSFARANRQLSLLDPAIEAQYRRLAEFEDELKTRVTLREFLLRINEPARVLRSHGQYLIGNFEVGSPEEYPGVDSKTAWYNRNLRIFANLQRLATGAEERVVLLIGAGHLPILRHAAESSPQWKLVEVAEVLGTPPPSVK